VRHDKRRDVKSLDRVDCWHHDEHRFHNQDRNRCVSQMASTRPRRIENDRKSGAENDSSKARLRRIVSCWNERSYVRFRVHLELSNLQNQSRITDGPEEDNRTSFDHAHETRKFRTSDELRICKLGKYLLCALPQLLEWIAILQLRSLEDNERKAKIVHVVWIAFSSFRHHRNCLAPEY